MKTGKVKEKEACHLFKQNKITSSYLHIAPMAIPSGKVVGRSLSECTMKSTWFCPNAISNSFVNKLFSPILGSGLSKISSPKVDMVTENIS